MIRTAEIDFDLKLARDTPLPDLLPVDPTFTDTEITQRPFEDPIVHIGPFSKYPLLLPLPYIGKANGLLNTFSPYKSSEFSDTTYIPFGRRSMVESLSLFAGVLAENGQGTMVTEMHRSTRVQARQFLEYLILQAAIEPDVDPKELIGTVATMVALPNKNPPHNSGTAADILQARTWGDTQYSQNILRYLAIVEFLESEISELRRFSESDFHDQNNIYEILDRMCGKHVSGEVGSRIFSLEWFLHNKPSSFDLEDWKSTYRDADNDYRRHLLWLNIHLDLYAYQKRSLVPSEYGLVFGDGGPRAQTSYFEQSNHSVDDTSGVSPSKEARDMRRQQYWLLQAINKRILQGRREGETDAFRYALLSQYAEESWHIDAEGGRKWASTHGGSAWNDGTEITTEQRQLDNVISFHLSSLPAMPRPFKATRFIPDMSSIPANERHSEKERRLAAMEAATKFAVSQNIVRKSDRGLRSTWDVYSGALRESRDM